MNQKEVIKRLKAGEKPIDLSIEKWEQMLEGTGYDKRGYNCALCQHHIRITSDGCMYGKDKCVLYKYASTDDDDDGGCGGFYYAYSMTHEENQAMLSFLYAVREAMIKDGVY